MSRNKEHIRSSSDIERKRLENALLISPTVAVTRSGGDASSLEAAAFARHSTRPGSNCLAHCRRIGFPDVEAMMRVFAQCAAVKES